MIDSFRGNHRFLSNFFPALCNYEGIVYPTVEHAYQASKSTDTSIRKTVAKALAAQEAKAMGFDKLCCLAMSAIKLEVERQI